MTRPTKGVTKDVHYIAFLPYLACLTTFSIFYPPWVSLPFGIHRRAVYYKLQPVQCNVQYKSRFQIYSELNVMLHISYILGPNGL